MLLRWSTKMALQLSYGELSGQANRLAHIICGELR